MEEPYHLINDQLILDLLYGDKEYFREFVLASIESFSEFRDRYNEAVKNRDLKVLRDAGHKIKPAALMMNLNRLLELYENSKGMLENEHAGEIDPLVEEMNHYSDQILADLHRMLNRWFLPGNQTFFVMKKHILVTGGAGFIGSHTVLELLQKGYKVTVIDNLSNSHVLSLKRAEELTGQPVQFIPMDLLDKESLFTLFSEQRFDSVIHFAGLKAVGESVEKPLYYYKNNIRSEERRVGKE